MKHKDDSTIINLIKTIMLIVKMVFDCKIAQDLHFTFSVEAKILDMYRVNSSESWCASIWQLYCA